MLMAQGFDPIFEGIGDALEAFALLFALAALAAFVGKVLVGVASAISLLVQRGGRRNDWPEGSTGPRVPD